MEGWISGGGGDAGALGREVVKGGVEEWSVAEMGVICSCLYFIE